VTFTGGTVTATEITTGGDRTTTRDVRRRFEVVDHAGSRSTRRPGATSSPAVLGHC